MSERPATLRRVPTPSDQPRRMADPQGKRSLFSDEVMPPSVGSVALHCSRCDSRSVVSVVQAAKLAMPMMYIPSPGSDRPGLDEVPELLGTQLGEGPDQVLTLTRQSLRGGLLVLIPGAAPGPTALPGFAPICL